MTMRRLIGVMSVALSLAACTPALNSEFLKEGVREFDPRHLLETPEVFRDKLFVFGGVIVETRLIEQGSRVEALFVPVDSYGHLRDSTRYHGRFYAILPAARGMLDPMIYKRGREISVAATFVEVRKGRIDEMEVPYPVFEIRQVYLWEEYSSYPYYYWSAPYYYYPHYYPYVYDPWWRPYPGYGWPPPPW